jgi:hypothetical protein
MQNEHRRATLQIRNVSVTGRGGLKGCQMLRIPHCLDNQFIDGGKVISRTQSAAALLHRNIIFMFLVLISVSDGVKRRA